MKARRLPLRDKLAISRSLAAKVRYVVDPANPYPKQFTGHLRVTLKDGRVMEARQGYFKGGADHPLSDADLQTKFFANCLHGGLAKLGHQGQRVDLSIHGTCASCVPQEPAA